MSYTPKNPNGSAVSASSSPVVIASDQATVPVSVSGVATAANQTTGNTSLGTIAGAVAGTEMQVDVLTMPTVTVNTHEVTATDLDIRNLVNTDVVTAELSAVDNAVLDAIEADTTAIAASVAAIDADTTTIIGHLDGVETTLTAIEGDTSAIQTAVQLIDDTVVTLGTDVYTEATSKGITLGAVRRDADTTLVGTTNEFTPLQVDANGRLKVEAFSGETLPVSLASTTITGTVAATQSGTWTVQPGNTQNTTEWLVIDKATTTGGLSKAHLVSAATTNATNVKASAGQVYAITAFNLNASPRYLKLHNTAGTPTAGTGVTDTFLIPGNTSGAGLVINFDKGIAFSTGIGFTLVTGITDASAVAVAADEIVLNIYYK